MLDRLSVSQHWHHLVATSGTLACTAVVAIGTPRVASSTAPAGQELSLNEIYVHHLPQGGFSHLEFIEVVGPPDLSLNGHMILTVDGDGSSRGFLDGAWDLSNSHIPSNGYFVLGDAGVPQQDQLLQNPGNLENGTQTFYLVETRNAPAIMALVGQNVDPDDDGVTEIASLATILDLVAIVDDGFPGPDRRYDGATPVGPNGSALPAGIYRGGNSPQPWCGGSFLDFDPGANLKQPRTPGASNGPCVSEVLYFQGQRHTSLGVAGLDVQPNQGLRITNLVGGSQPNGVSIDVDQAQAFEFFLDTPPGSNPPDGPVALVAANGLVAGSEVNLVEMEIAAAGTNFEIDVSNSVPSFTVLRYLYIYLNYTQVACIPILIDWHTVSFQPTSCHIAPWQTWCPWWPCPWWHWPIDDPLPDFEQYASLITLDSAVQITVDGVGQYTGNRIAFVNQANPTQAYGGLTTVEVTGQSSALSTLLIDDERLVVHGNAHESMSGARLDASLAPSRLEVTPAPNGNVFGVRLQVEGNKQGIDVGMEPVPIFELDNARFTLEAEGSVNGTNTDFGSLNLHNVGNSIVEASVNFVDLASPTGTLEVYDGDALVASIPITAGQFATFEPVNPGETPSLTSCGKLAPIEFICWGSGWDIPTLVNAGGQSAVGDRFQVLATGSSVVVEGLNEFAISMTEFDGLTIVSEVVTNTCQSAQYCAATANSTGSEARMFHDGSCAVSDVVFTLGAAPVPNQPGIFFYGRQAGQTPFGPGFLCVSGSLCRLPVVFAADNVMSLEVDLTTLNGACAIAPGDTVYFQSWFRDPAAGGVGFNTSDGLELTFY